MFLAGQVKLIYLYLEHQKMIFDGVIKMKLKSKFDFNHERNLLPLAQILLAVNISHHSSFSALKENRRNRIQF